jgi:hypothetical protein
VAEAAVRLVPALADSADDVADLPSWVEPTSTTAKLHYGLGHLYAEADRTVEARGSLSALQHLLPQLPSHYGGYAPDLEYVIALEDENYEEAGRPLEASLRRNAQDGLAVDGALLQNNLADLALRRGDRRAAARGLAAAWQAIIDCGDLDLTVLAAQHMSAAVGPDVPLLCARVAGCSEAARVGEGFPLDAGSATMHERRLIPIRARVDPDAWVAAVAQGRGESLFDLFDEMAQALVAATDEQRP